jgi:hypothetical protein
MSKFHAVIGNPRLEQHFIHFVGFKHMHRYSKMYIDPTSEYEPELQGMYYESMRDGAYEDLKKALREEAELDTKDSDFRKIIEAAIADVVGRLGMELIIRKTKEFLWEMEGRTPDDIPMANSYFPKPEFSRCPTCNKTRFVLGMEDLPAEIFHTYSDIGLDMSVFWLCLKCKRISNE